MVVATFGPSDLSSFYSTPEAVLKNIESCEIACANSYDPRQVSNLFALIKKKKINVINSHGYRADFIGLIASRFFKIPIVPTFHGWTAVNLKIKLFEKLDEFVFKRAKHIFTVSRANSTLLQQKGIPECKITVIPNAIDPEVYKGTSKFENLENLKSSLGFHNREKVLISIGRLSKEKGHEIALKAFSNVIKEMPECRLVILGNGPEETRLKTMATNLGISDKVLFLGFQPNVVDYLNISDICLLTSFTEGLPTVILEAFMSSKFVIATSVGGTPEVVQDKRTGILIPPGDIGKLSQETVFYLKNDGEREKISKAAFQFVMENYTFDSHVGKMEKVLSLL